MDTRSSAGRTPVHCGEGAVEENDDISLITGIIGGVGSIAKIGLRALFGSGTKTVAAKAGSKLTGKAVPCHSFLPGTYVLMAGGPQKPRTSQCHGVHG